MTQQPLQIMFAGSGEFGLPTLNALMQAGHHIVAVYTQPDRPAGRGRVLTPTAIGQFALAQNLNLIRTADINAEPLPPADLLVVIAFGQKISEEVTRHPRLGSVNLHSSRLPAYRGAAPINWAILNGDKTTGNSIIRLAQRMDAGAVLGMSELPIGQLETAGELHDRLSLDGAPLMLQVVDSLAKGQATESPQDESQATRAIKLSRDASLIDWNVAATAIALKVRGMYPWPGCRVRLLDTHHKEHARLTLVRARALDTTPDGIPGVIMTSGLIGTADGELEVIDVQPEGKKPMPLSAFRNGNRWDVGFRLEPLA